MPTGSAVANLSVLGYDPHQTFQGRGVLEAASLGIELSQNDMAMRINLISVENNRIRSHSADHITNEEAKQLIPNLEGNIESADFFTWDYGLPVGSPELFAIQEKIHGYDLKNLYICGDYMGLPSLDACIESSKSIAEKLVMR